MQLRSYPLFILFLFYLYYINKIYLLKGKIKFNLFKRLLFDINFKFFICLLVRLLLCACAITDPFALIKDLLACALAVMRLRDNSPLSLALQATKVGGHPLI
jgi:hypothetical protein